MSQMPATPEPPFLPATRVEPFDYARLRRDLARAVARLCPAWLLNDRDDLVQAAVMRVLQVFGRRNREGEGAGPVPSSYLYKTAYSALVDEIRRVRRRRETTLADEIVESLPAADNPVRAAASREIGAGIQQCLAGLSRDRRLAVTLYLQGHSVPRASQILEWSTKRTENLVFRGLSDLRKCLSSKGLHP